MSRCAIRGIRRMRRIAAWMFLARLVAQSRDALRLAQARYEAGLGSIVELNEAQLSETSAEITAAERTTTISPGCAELDYAAGLLN